MEIHYLCIVKKENNSLTIKKNDTTMVNYNKSIDFDLRNKASKCLTHYLNELKRNHGDLNRMVNENEESIEFIVSSMDNDPNVIRVTDLGIALEIPVEVEIHNMDIPSLPQTLITKSGTTVSIYSTEDSDSPRYKENYKALMPDFLRVLSAIETSRSKMESDYDHLKADVEISLNRVRRNIAKLVRSYGQECSEGTFTIALNDERITWEGHSFYRIMVEDFGSSEFELRDIQDNYYASNDIHDNRFLFELYAKVLRLTGAAKI